MTAPLVVTLLLDDATQARFDAQRRELFPRTAVGAHVTLFHALPGSAPVAPELAIVADRPGFEVEVSGVMALGRGVAYRLVSAELLQVHGLLRSRFADELTRQDAQPFRPHVTVQNKVPPEEARATFERLSAGFAPFRATATGLALWAYEGGPWTLLSRFPFR